MVTTMTRRMLPLLVGASLLSGCGYNALVGLQQNIQAAWAQVQNQLQRRNDLAGPHDVGHRNPMSQQVIRDDSAVAAPPHGFGAHDGATLDPPPTGLATCYYRV